MPAAVLSDPRVASVGTTNGDQVVTAIHSADGGRLAANARAERPGLLGGAAGTNDSVIVGADALGPAAGE